MSEAASKKTFDEQIAANCRDVAALTAIEAQLRTISAPWAEPMLLRIIYMRHQLSTAVTRAGQAAAPAPLWAAPFGVPPPDGRPLYRYRVKTDAFSNLESHLKLRARKEGFSRREDEALLVLWAAEWFRRGFKGGLRRWSDIGGHFGIDLPQAGWRALADRGLKLWQIPPLRLNGVTHRLLNLARQGGFPLAAIADGATGWAATYLGRLVGVLLGERDATADTAFAHAEALGSMIPVGWRHEELFIVSADLATAVVALRREAETGGLLAGLPPSTWLDAHHPEWREQLPLTIDSDACRQLIDGLMKAETARGGTGAVRIARVLKCVDGTWREHLQFELNGHLRIAELRSLEADWSRLRMFARGRLARYVSGELAALEPGDGGEWVAIASRAPGSVPVPFDVLAEVELRGGGERIGPVINLGQGDAVHARMLICRNADETGDGLPTRLVLIGTTSGKYRPDPLYLVVPLDWTFEPESADPAATAEPLGYVTETRQLWRLRGAATVVSPERDRYRVFAGQDHDDRTALVLLSSGSLPVSATSVDDLPVYRGAPVLLVREHGRERPLRTEELWWRPVGTRDWREFARLETLGACELALRDRTGFLLDRHVAVILPDAFKLTLHRSGDYTELVVSGWPGTVTVTPGQETTPGQWRIRARGARELSATILLEASNLASIRLTVRLPHEPWIYDWEGAPLREHSRIALAQFHGFVARAHGRCTLMAELHDRENHRVPEADARWSFEDELPFNTIREDLAALLRPAGDLDATVKVSFNDNYQLFWDACEFDVHLASEPRGLVPIPAVIDVGARIAGRAIGHPVRERDFGQYALAGQPNHRPITLPSVDGCWLIYLRNGERILTRPYRYLGQSLGPLPSEKLGRAMAIADWKARMSALASFCDEAECDEERGSACVRAIIELASGLDGLPPSTFDVFLLLPSRPLLAARLLFEAGDQELTVLVALDAGLPFAWPLIAKCYWDRAAEMRFNVLLRALPDTLSDRLALTAEAIGKSRGRIAALVPMTAPLLNQPSPAAPISQAAQIFMQR
ncbi:MAG: STY4851/ECs_5259 family protein, partial [Acetobacteraceae bacterium]